MTQAVMPRPAAEVGDEFALDLRVIEDSLPLAKMSCDTEDNCGNTTCGSACTSQVAQAPF
ncbi:FxLD family lanthipeptide [Amycolatopsis anabasis]|uniref:FxLD family lanthipeptide n=1 Tax=Amycolatopsis anabasis TaxID=1840409 RepID=UPI00131D5B53|nr:FxLD family lanthipeptide [Amycolatopsis anabasis]